MASIPKSVYDVVVAVVSDYDRMNKMLDKGTVTREQAISFTRKVAAVDNALLMVCENESEEVIKLLRKDIAQKRGFVRSYSKAFINKNTFDKRKSEAIRQIARLLVLI